MPGHRKYPLRIMVEGSPIQVKSVGNGLFQSKSNWYQAYYDSSGKLIGKALTSQWSQKREWNNIETVE